MTKKLTLKECNEAFDAYKANTLKKNLLSNHEVISAQQAGALCEHALFTRAGFVSTRTKRTDKEEGADVFTDEDRLRNEKDFVATFLNMCGLYPDEEDGSHE